MPRATVLRSTSGASGTLRAWTLRIFSRPTTSGLGTTIWRSKRPGRSSAGSSTSGRLVAAIRMMPSFDSNPSISTSKLVQSLLALVVAAAQTGAAMPADRVDLVDEDDAGRVLLGLLEHVAHTTCADTDKHLDEIGAGDREERHVRLAGDRACKQASCQYRADRPEERRAESARQAAGTFCGSRRNSTISCRSSLASSTPATSSKVTRPCASVKSFAFDLPKPSALPPVPCIWRMKKIHTAKIRNIGNHEISIPSRDWPPSATGLAEIATPRCSRRFTSSGSSGA